MHNKHTLVLSPMPLSHKTTEALTDSSASKTFHEYLIMSRHINISGITCIKML
jgi:hypothetical protein